VLPIKWAPVKLLELYMFEDDQKDGVADDEAIVAEDQDVGDDADVSAEVQDEEKPKQSITSAEMAYLNGALNALLTTAELPAVFFEVASVVDEGGREAIEIQISCRGNGSNPEERSNSAERAAVSVFSTILRRPDKFSGFRAVYGRMPEPPHGFGKFFIRISRTDIARLLVNFEESGVADEIHAKAIETL
jgi:hypothetical protein